MDLSEKKVEEREAERLKSASVSQAYDPYEKQALLFFAELCGSSESDLWKAGILVTVAKMLRWSSTAESRHDVPEKIKERLKIHGQALREFLEKRGVKSVDELLAQAEEKLKG